MRSICSVATLFVLCSVSAASAATYYVAPGGNDNNNGSSGSPWATIQNFGNFATAGDTLIVRAGSYAGAIFGWDGPNQGLYSQISGTAAKPIVIEADPNAAPGAVIINGRNAHQPNALDFEPGCDYVNIIGFTITDPNNVLTKCGMECTGTTGNQILNLTVNGSSGVGGILVDNGTNVLIQNNVCMNVLGTGSTGHGMYLSGHSLNCTIRGNVLHDNAYVGLHINGADFNTGSGIVSGALIERNTIYNNGQNAINADGLNNSTIRNNLIYSYTRSGIVLYQIDAAAGGNNNVIVNNIFASPKSGAEAALRFVNASTGNHVFNNVMFGGGNVFLDVSSDSLPGLLSDYNAVSTLFENDDTGATESLAQWRTQSGNDTHSFTSTNSAMFVNAAGGNYHSLSASPGIDAGTASLGGSGAPTNDIENNPRPSGNGYDIGCYEVQSGALQITTASPLPQGTVGAAYSTSFAASGGTPGYTFTVSVNSPPSGLTLSSAGVLSGTPTGSGTTTFTVQVTDSANATATKQFQITINAAPSITTASLPAGTVGAAYNQTLAPSGGASPLTWSFTGTMPSGLSLSASTGAITGTPTAASSPSLTFKVTDANGATATKTLTLTINTALAITTTSLPQGMVGAAYSQTLAASGGTSPLSWSFTGTMPSGMTLSSSGAITGTPTTASSPSLTFKVTDANGATATKALTLTINAALAITTAAPLPVGTVGIAYSQTFAANGGIGADTWSTTGGTLPTGLALNNVGVLSGTPTTAGPFTFTVQVSDSATHIASKSFSVTINTVTITTPSPLTAGTVGTAYSNTFAAVGGATPYTWSVLTGPLPGGLSLSAAGLLSGTPAAAGTFNFTIQVSDKNHATGSKAFALTVNPLLVLTSISVTPASATVKSGATQQFSAVALDQFNNALATQPAFTWSVSGGGTIDATGLFTANAGGAFTVTAANGNVSGAASVRVNAPPTITSPPGSSSPIVVVNTPANFGAGAIDPNGGPVTYTWNFGDGATASGPNVSHTYTTIGTFTVTVTIADNSGDVTTTTLQITVVAAGAPPPNPMTVTKLSGSMKFKAAGHDAFSIKGVLPGLPAGLTLSGQTVALSLSGASVTFTLDKHGHGKNAQGAFVLKLPLTRVAKLKTFAGGNGAFTASLHNGAWAMVWGFDPTKSASKQTVQMTATIQFNGATYSQTVSVTYSIKAGVGGTFKH